MSEWWTYRLSDILPFSPQTYYRLFELHNAAVWPVQIVALALGALLLVLALLRAPWSGRVVALLLAGAWGFVGWSFLGTRYAALNWAAVYFAYAFAAQALLLVLVGALGDRLTFASPKPLTAWVGVAIAAFAVFLQPLIGPLLGRPWPGVELFGVAPDPTVLATLGILLAADRVRFELLTIPILWCGVTGATLYGLGAPEALFMPAAGLFALGLAGYRAFPRTERG